jgi:hypothetical protein
VAIVGNVGARNVETAFSEVGGEYMEEECNDIATGEQRGLKKTGGAYTLIGIMAYANLVGFFY